MSDNKNRNANSYSPLALAYIGDAVFEMLIRDMILINAPVNKLHRTAREYVKAEAQSNMVQKLLPHLTEDEERVYKRGRNTTSHTVPKNADIVHYRRATGLESLFGYLYINQNYERINQLFKICTMPL